MLECPVFNANSTLYANLGLLKVVEAAAREHGDFVLLHTRDDLDTYLVAGKQSVQFWQTHSAQLHAEFNDVRSGGNTMSLLLGESAQNASWGRVVLPLRRALAAVRTAADGWYDASLRSATAALIDQAHGEVTDLRELTRLWSVRSVADTIFGPAFCVARMARGIADVQDFFRFVSTRTADDLAEAERFEEFRHNRAFLDQVVQTSVEAAHPGDPTLIAVLLRALPADLCQAERTAYLRTVLFRILFEKLSVDGLCVLWALVHLAGDTDLAAVLASEPDAEPGADDPPLAMSLAKETLRLYPERPFHYRMASQELAVGDARVPPGATVLFAPWLLHRDRRYWPEPARFDGRRFLSGETDPDCYLPFGITREARARTRFTLHQLSVALHAITSAREFAVSSACPPGNLRPFVRSKLAPRGPVPFRFRPRTQPASPGRMQ